MLRFILLLLPLQLVLPVHALELFGVDLSVATRNEIRSAVKKSGARLVSEAGKDKFFDVYEGAALLHNADRLYLGFVKKDRRFAFVEYEFNGLQQPAMLTRLIRKYGQPSTSNKAQKFITDFQYLWQVDDVQIRLYQDWPAYKTRLSYTRPESLLQLQAEQQMFERARREQKLVFNEQAY